MNLERRVINIYDTPYTSYDLEGPAQEDMQLQQRNWSGLVCDSDGARRSVHPAHTRIPGGVPNSGR